MMMKPVIAVTLGSNGFHLYDAALTDGRLEIIRHLYEQVQAESYLGAAQRMSEEGVQRICHSLAGFRTYIEANPGRLCAAIATATFRRAANGAQLVARAEQALGVRINVLTGPDEGLCCYLGIASSLGLTPQPRLVIDIGGGSTELMIAIDDRLVEFVSLDLGCLPLTDRFFSPARVDAADFAAAVARVADVVAPVARRFKATGWAEVIGCGGSVTSLLAVLQHHRMALYAISQAGLNKFQDAVVQHGGPDAVALNITPPGRARLLPAGASILQGVYHVLGVERLTPVATAVGQGLIVQLLQRQLATGSLHFRPRAG